MKHLFPEYRHVYCNEKHTLEQAKLFVELANKVGLPINALTLEDLFARSFVPYG